MVAVLVAGRRPLDESSVLCLGDRRVVGKVEDVFGPVSAPMYLLRVRTRRDVPQEEIETQLAAAGVGKTGPAAIGEVGVPLVVAAAPAPPQPSALSLLAADYDDDDEGEERVEGKAEVNDESLVDGAHHAACDVVESGAEAATPTAAVANDEVAAVAAAAAPPPAAAESLIRLDDMVAGTLICSVSALSKFVFPEQIRRAFPKGSDASNFYDEEVAMGGWSQHTSS